MHNITYERFFWAVYTMKWLCVMTLCVWWHNCFYWGCGWLVRQSRTHLPESGVNLSLWKWHLDVHVSVTLDVTVSVNNSTTKLYKVWTTTWLVRFSKGCWCGVMTWCKNLHCFQLVSRGQTLFCTEGKGLGYGHRATCCPTPWSAYQSQHSIQSHDTWSMWWNSVPITKEGKSRRE